MASDLTTGLTPILPEAEIPAPASSVRSGQGRAAHPHDPVKGRRRTSSNDDAKHDDDDLSAEGGEDSLHQLDRLA